LTNYQEQRQTQIASSTALVDSVDKSEVASSEEAATKQFYANFFENSKLKDPITGRPKRASYSHWNADGLKQLGESLESFKATNKSLAATTSTTALDSQLSTTETATATVGTSDPQISPSVWKRSVKRAATGSFVNNTSSGSNIYSTRAKAFTVSSVNRTTNNDTTEASRSNGTSEVSRSNSDMINKSMSKGSTSNNAMNERSRSKNDMNAATKKAERNLNMQDLEDLIAENAARLSLQEDNALFSSLQSQISDLEKQIQLQTAKSSDNAPQTTTRSGSF
jgi:hypothetical protein